MEAIHELVRVRMNKEIKLRLTGEQKESTESIGKRKRWSGREMWATGHRDQLERKEAVEKNEC